MLFERGFHALKVAFVQHLIDNRGICLTYLMIFVVVFLFFLYSWTKKLTHMNLFKKQARCLSKSEKENDDHETLWRLLNILFNGNENEYETKRCLEYCSRPDAKQPKPSVVDKDAFHHRPFFYEHRGDLPSDIGRRNLCHIRGPRYRARFEIWTETVPILRNFGRRGMYILQCNGKERNADWNYEERETRRLRARFDETVSDGVHCLQRSRDDSLQDV